MISGTMYIKEADILERYWTKMSFEQIREVEKYIDDGVIRYEFSDMINDFFTLVIN